MEKKYKAQQKNKHILKNHHHGENLPKIIREVIQRDTRTTISKNKNKETNA